MFSVRTAESSFTFFNFLFWVISTGCVDNLRNSLEDLEVYTMICFWQISLYDPYSIPGSFQLSHDRHDSHPSPCIYKLPWLHHTMDKRNHIPENFASKLLLLSPFSKGNIENKSNWWMHNAWQAMIIVKINMHELRMRNGIKQMFIFNQIYLNYCL